MPWGVQTYENKDLKNARTILDRDHYGMEEVKKRVLVSQLAIKSKLAVYNFIISKSLQEFIAVGKMKQNHKGKILCFCGPPGVGKRSVARSVASALNREVYVYCITVSK